jgi:Protein of unknown function (DUF3102)
MTTVAVKGETKVARPLRVLVPLIKEELDAGYSAGIEHYRRAGEMLIEAKSQLEHGEWEPWLKQNFELSRRTAYRYMALIRSGEQDEMRRDPGTFQPRTLSEALGDLRTSADRGHWTRPVREVVSRVNVNRLAEERQSREREAALIKQLAHQLVDIGYRVLAAKLHPDRPGGSHEAMKRLNAVRRLLKEAV